MFANRKRHRLHLLSIYLIHHIGWFVDMTIEHVFERRQMAFVFRLPPAIESKIANTIGAFNSSAAHTTFNGRRISRANITQNGRRNNFNVYIPTFFEARFAVARYAQLFALWIIHSFDSACVVAKCYQFRDDVQTEIVSNRIREALAIEQDAFGCGKK